MKWLRGWHVRRRARGAIRWSVALLTVIVFTLSVADWAGWCFYLGTSSALRRGRYVQFSEGHVDFAWSPKTPMFSPMLYDPAGMTNSQGAPSAQQRNLSFTRRINGYAHSWNVVMGKGSLFAGEWFVCSALGVATAWLWIPARFRYGSYRTGTSHACGYSMNGLERGAKCPECGAGAAG